MQRVTQPISVCLRMNRCSHHSGRRCIRGVIGRQVYAVCSSHVNHFSFAKDCSKGNFYWRLNAPKG